MTPRLWTWPRLVVVTAARAVLVVLLGLAAWGALPAVLGWHPTTVSSGSMMPRLHVGDVAVSRPLHGHVPTIGSVLLFDDPDHPGRLRMHRFVRVGDDGALVTRGDANPADDSSEVGLAQVRGIGTLRVPWVGLPVVWSRTGRWAALGLTAAGLGLLLALALGGRDRGFADDQDPPGPLRDPPDDPSGGAPDDPSSGAPTGIADGPQAEGGRTAGGSSGAPAPGSSTPLARRLLVVGATLLLTTATITPAGAGFASATTGRVALTANPYFSCANALTALAPYVWYRMDETSSTATSATDSSGGGRTGVYGLLGKTSVTTKACTRDTGRAMTFNGSTGYLSGPAGAFSTPPNTFSLAIWFRTTTTAGGKLIGFGSSQTGASSSYDRHIYMTNAGKVVFGVYPGSVKTVASPTGLNDGVWHLAVATLSSAGMRLYVDKTLVGSDDTVTTGESAASTYLRVGYDNLDSWTEAPSSRFFAGSLDDAAELTTVLSASQVAALYEAGT